MACLNASRGHESEVRTSQLLTRYLCHRTGRACAARKALHGTRAEQAPSPTCPDARARTHSAAARQQKRAEVGLPRRCVINEALWRTMAAVRKRIPSEAATSGARTFDGAASDSPTRSTPPDTGCISSCAMLNRALRVAAGLHDCVGHVDRSTARTRTRSAPPFEPTPFSTARVGPEISDKTASAHPCNPA